MSVLSSPKAPRSIGNLALTTDNHRGSRPQSSSSRIGRLLDDRLRQIVFGRLSAIDEGRLAVVEGGRRHEFGPPDAGMEPVEMHVHDPRFYRRLAAEGSLGAAEAYIRGDWDCDWLVDLLRLFCRNPSVSAGFERGLVRLLEPARRVLHYLRRNTLDGSRRNIAAHYDLGDDFFSLFLDETMAYSSGIFPTPQSTLREASLTKFDRVCRKLQLSQKDHVMEIGSGWGGFAVYAARRYGCRVTTTTISNRQYEYTRRRVRAENLEDRVTILREDYRKLTGRYDKLVSIEMIEAVGHRYMDDYFRICSGLLKPGGLMCLQAITIPDQRFDQYVRSVDFIQRYIFPGGCLPSPGSICRSLGRATEMQPVHFEDFGTDYAETLDHWRRRFHENIDRVRALCYSEEFVRLWNFYFSYCEAGFRENMTGVAQWLLRRQHDGEPPTPSPTEEAWNNDSTWPIEERAHALANR